MPAVIGNPAMLIALALVAVPIVFHILARRRYATVQWAATDLLKRAKKRLRQRVEIKDLVLLALRVGAIAFAVLGAAGVLVPADGWLRSIARHDREIVLVFDRSPSMAALRGDTSRLAESIRRADALVASLGTDDRVTIVAYDAAVHAIGRSLRPAEARVALEQVAVGPIADHPTAVLRSLGASLRVGPGAKQVFVFSHFSATGWPRAATAALARETARGEPIEWCAVPTGRVDRGNLRVASITCRPRHPRIGEPCELRVRLENTDGAPTGRRIVRTAIGGREIDVRPVALDARATKVVTIATRLGAAGPTDVAARVDPDALPVDDAHFAVVIVTPSAAIALVETPGNGSPRPPLDRPLDFVHTALTAAFDRALGDGGFPGRPDRRGLPKVERISPDELDCPRLAIVSPAVRITTRFAERLDRVRRAGGTAFVVAGPRPDGDGVGFGLDGRIETWPEGRVMVLTEAGRRHPSLRFVAELGEAELARARVFCACVPASLPADATTLIAADHPNGAPLLVERRDPGSGGLLWWASSFTPAWTDLPTPAAGNQFFVPFLLEVVRAAIAPGIAAPRLLPGESWAAAAGVAGRVLGPDGLAAEADDQGVARMAAPGVYRRITGDRIALAAVNPAPAESDAEDLDAIELAARFPAGSVWEGEPLRVGARPGRGALDRTMLILAALCLVAEMISAWAFGRGRG